MIKKIDKEKVYKMEIIGKKNESSKHEKACSPPVGIIMGVK